ncbi:Immunoglobulin V-set domain [Popillia japonica]|uniref:Immunoglobulin V-set domain n=1 Tax=Popillia japonica TaxID=7064 RepID=A0AAW1JX18_POPJA
MAANKSCTALRDVKILVPPAVERGHRAVLRCFYNLEGDALYTVKWYRGRREFFRYTPKENPPTRQFPIDGLTVLESESNATHIVLAEVQMENSGIYSCEVSADAPSFFTDIKTRHLQVIIPPIEDPKITGIKNRYRFGDYLKAECRSRNSVPAANLTWLVNDKDVEPIHIRHQKPSRNSVPAANLTWLVNDKDVEPIHIRHQKPHVTGEALFTSVSGLRFKITEDRFSAGRLKVRCIASLYDIYHRSSEISVEMERQKPRVYKSMTTPSTMGFSGVNVHNLDDPENHATLIFAQPAAEVTSLTTKLSAKFGHIGFIFALLFNLR